RALDPHPRGGRGRVHARHHHRARQGAVRRHARTAHAAGSHRRGLPPHHHGRPDRRRELRARTMRNTFVILKRELGGYFTTPVAYVFIFVFLSLIGFLTFQLGGFYEREQADLQSFFDFHPWVYLFLVPAVSMRLWAEERRQGTIELLFTLPITLGESVIGKFLAAWLFLGLALVLTFPMWI